LLEGWRPPTHQKGEEEEEEEEWERTIDRHAPPL